MSEESFVALEKLHDAARIAMSAKYRLAELAETFDRLGLMPDVADELRAVGVAVHQAIKDAQDADAAATTAQIREQEKFHGEMLMGLLQNATKGKSK